MKSIIQKLTPLIRWPSRIDIRGCCGTNFRHFVLELGIMGGVFTVFPWYLCNQLLTHHAPGFWPGLDRLEGMLHGHDYTDVKRQISKNCIVGCQTSGKLLHPAPKPKGKNILLISNLLSMLNNTQLMDEVRSRGIDELEDFIFELRGKLNELKYSSHSDKHQFVSPCVWFYLASEFSVRTHCDCRRWTILIVAIVLMQSK